MKRASASLSVGESLDAYTSLTRSPEERRTILLGRIMVIVLAVAIPTVAVLLALQGHRLLRQVLPL